MITQEQANEVLQKISAMKDFRHPEIVSLGIINDGDGYAIGVYFGGEQPSINLPEEVDGVRIIYEFEMNDFLYE